MRRILGAVLVIGAVACGGDSTPPLNGPLKLGIISGNHQVVPASNQHLTDAVVGKLVRAPDGTVSFHWTDVILPAMAVAQSGTVVTGSPVPGAVVCAVSVDATHPLTPFVPCTNTDVNGQATFFFNTSTKAGVAKAEIRGTLNSAPAVFDTAIATVTAESVSPTFHHYSFILTSPAVLSDTAVTDLYGNAVPFAVVPDGRITVQDTTVGSIGARTIVFSASQISNSDFTTDLHGAGGVLIGHMRYRIGTGSSGQPAATFITAGLSITP